VANFTKTLADGQAASPGPTSVYAPPALTKALIRQMTVTNIATTVVTLTVQVTTKTAGTPRTIISARNVAVNEAYLCPEILNCVIDVGGAILIGASQATALNYVISGVEMT